jgi:hypothetical protein
VAVAYLRTVKTASNATAVQIVHSSRRGSREIEHIGSAHTPEDVEVLKAVARQRLHANQDTLDFGDGRPSGQSLRIVATQSKQLWDALCLGYAQLGFDAVCGDDEVFRSLALARLVEPTSKLEAIRVLDELGIGAPSYRTIKRRLPGYATDERRQRLAAPCAAHVGLGPATLVLYDVTTLYFETDEGDGFREPGFSKERRFFEGFFRQRDANDLLATLLTWQPRTSVPTTCTAAVWEVRWARSRHVPSCSRPPPTSCSRCRTARPRSHRSPTPSCGPSHRRGDTSPASGPTRPTTKSWTTP